MPAKNQFKYTEQQLLDELRKAAAFSCRPSITILRFKQYSPISISCYKRRYGTWNGALAAAGLQTGLVTRRNPTDPAEILCRIATHAPKRERKTKNKKQKISAKSAKSADGENGKGKNRRFFSASSASSAVKLGRPLNFRGIIYEPQSEQAVVHLFGAVSEEMGYRVEKIQHAFPDCIALRRVPGGRGAWERVRVEFELRSSQFRLHKHNPAGCDVIVCWEHDWQASPLEVLELRLVVQALCAKKKDEGWIFRNQKSRSFFQHQEHQDF